MKVGDLIRIKETHWHSRGDLGIIINAFPVNLNKPEDFESKAFKILLSSGKIISKLRDQIEVISEN